MNIKIKKISLLINKALVNVEKEIDMHKKGLKADATISELKIIKNELTLMKKYMSPSKYVPIYNFMIRDSWNKYNHLGEDLLKVANEYKEKLL